MTLVTDERLSRLKKIVKRWSRIQADIKKAEQVSRVAVGPSINELRYAGRILVSAFVEQIDGKPLTYYKDDDYTDELENTSFDDKIAIAQQYLTNADNDISDALFYFFQKRIDDINSRYGQSAVVLRYPPYQNLVENTEKSRDLIIESRKNSSLRQKNYITLRRLRNKIISNYYDLHKSDVIMTSELEKLNKKSKRYKTLSSILFGLIICLTAYILVR